MVVETHTFKGLKIKQTSSLSLKFQNENIRKQFPVQKIQHLETRGSLLHCIISKFTTGSYSPTPYLHIPESRPEPVSRVFVMSQNARGFRSFTGKNFQEKDLHDRESVCISIGFMRIHHLMAKIKTLKWNVK